METLDFDESCPPMDAIGVFTIFQRSAGNKNKCATVALVELVLDLCV